MDVIENKPGSRIAGIVVHNLTKRTTTFDLLKMFQEIGEIDSIDMNVDATGFPLGSANIIFKDRNDVAKAYNELNAARLDGQSLMLTILRENRNKLYKTGKVNNCYSVDMYFMSRFQKNHSKVKNEWELNVDALCNQIDESIF
ncbi:PREDICTED: THO complex subunit 4-B-like [Nicrophorus vespilloides]|uniref:THO complex subunit 4-B-like n=1 Tax=Nicrophorus vespilloides TaxID=110193 RepID=A0ABM1MMA0_NICVS|nr:PREDICTED: THO complex subunit 4-B-like [Nicrophorus vespilloides]